MLTDLTIEEFVNEVASSSPAPGGGSVAAFAGAQAAGLLSMYCNLSQKRDKLGDVVDLIQKTGEEARYIKEKLLEAIDEDTLAFNKVMDAYRMPKDDEKARGERNNAVQKAVLYAAEVPLQTARRSLRILSLIKDIEARGNPSAITDLGVANLHAYSGLIGACYNVQINISLLNDNKTAADFNHEVAELHRQGENLFIHNKALIENNLS
ncbi:MAG: cyclodeaminase/cyclohydrolase family protein [Bacillota bacterium]|nr:cyclodeaminase/cyclohydrolase family protein [Bacillota bacterium]